MKLIITCSRDSGGIILYDTNTSTFNTIRDKDVRGIKYNSSNNSFYYVSSIDRSVYKTTEKFEVVKRIDFGRDGHGLFIYKNLIYIVCTYEDTIYVFDEDLTYVTKYQFEKEDGDYHHINDLYIKDDFMYITMISYKNNGPQFNKRIAKSDKLGVLVKKHISDKSSNFGDVIIKDLSHPHSPYFFENRLYVSNSGCGYIHIYDDKYKLIEQIYTGGYPKGLFANKEHLVVTVDKIRETYIENNIQKEYKSNVKIFNHKYELQNTIYNNFFVGNNLYTTILL